MRDNCLSYVMKPYLDSIILARVMMAQKGSPSYFDVESVIRIYNIIIIMAMLSEDQT